MGVQEVAHIWIEITDESLFEELKKREIIDKHGTVAPHKMKLLLSMIDWDNFNAEFKCESDQI